MSRHLIAFLAFSMLLISQSAESKPINPCASSATTAGGTLLVCPAGDGPTLADIGATIDVTVMIGPSDDPTPYPSFGMLPSDIWVSPIGDYGYPLLCNGAYSCNADDYLDENGHTTISGSIAAGGYSEDPVYVVAIGQAIQRGEECDNPIPLVLVSPDINGDFAVDAADLALFAQELGSGGSDPHVDFNGDGVVNLLDLGLFAPHYSHRCEN